MIKTFFATLTPMLTLFFLIVVGFFLQRGKLLPETAGKTIAKLETFVCVPALCFSTMGTYCTIETLGTHLLNLTFSIVEVALAIGISIPLSLLFAKRGTEARGVYLYALTFANSGYMGDPIVEALFGTEGLAYYKIACLPISIAIYVWGIGCMVKTKGKNPLLRLVNPPTVALFLGIAVGLLGIYGAFPLFIRQALDALRATMGPLAMLLAGITIAGYRMRDMLLDKKLYIASLLRLLLLPAVLILALFAFKAILTALGLTTSYDILFLVFFAVATPLGLNTVVFPEAYGGDSRRGAGMTMISHTLAVVTIPLLYALMVVLFGTPFA